MSFFMVDPSDRQIVLSAKTIEASDKATDLDENLIVRSIVREDSEENRYEYGLLMDNAIVREDTAEPEHLIATGSSPEGALEASQADDGSFGEKSDISDKFIIERIDEGSLPEIDELSLNSTVSIADYIALCQIVEAEAKSEDIQGKRLVANVILNRTDSARYPDSIENVILDDGQFDPVENGIYYRTVPGEDSKFAVMSALNGNDDSQDALFFQRSASSVWGDKVYLFRYGSHSFYR